jgi:hypothetical protein
MSIGAQIVSLNPSGSVTANASVKVNALLDVAACDAGKCVLRAQCESGHILLIP